MAERLPSGGQIGEFAPSDFSALQCAVKSLKVGRQELGSLISEFDADRLLDVARMGRVYEPRDLGSGERKLYNELELDPLKFIATALAQRVCGDGVDVTADQVQRALYTLEDLWNGSEYASEVPNEKHKRYILTGKDA